ncbi:hypothetical protein K502DRAFT_326065 [Neoconidiobolus thromboides FSU 785]|nr:hypothetical protein K502DRAFT_326065 [Neoconidiobolus thromboides FSU 785]
MSLKFDQLPDVLLEGIFKQSDPKELFKYRFLNKYLLKIINYVINYNLIHSLYYSGNLDCYDAYQQRFIEQNGSLMKHLIIEGHGTVYLKYNPKLFIHYIENNGDVNNDSSKTKTNLSQLRKLIISGYDDERLLNSDKYCLNQIEVFEVSGSYIVVKDIIQYFNPNKLKSFIVYSVKRLNLDGLDVLKSKFNKLKVLKLEADEIVIPSNKLDSKLSFVSRLDLEINAGRFNSFNFNYFGDLKKLKSIKLIDRSGDIFRVDSTNKNLKMIMGSNIITLGHFDFESSTNFSSKYTTVFGIKVPVDSSLKSPVAYELMKLSSLKEIYIKEISANLLKYISLFRNIQKIQISNHNKIGKAEIEHIIKNSLFKCKFIKQIEIKHFRASFRDLVFLSLVFPNLKVFKATVTFHLSEYKQSDYYITSPLLLVAPINDKTLYKKLIKHQMIDWYVLD